MKRTINYLFLVGYFICLMLPLAEFKIRYRHDAMDNKNAPLTETGFFKNFWADLTGDFETQFYYGFNYVFPIVTLAFLVQLLNVYAHAKSYDKLLSILSDWKTWLSVGIAFGLNFLLFYISFNSHIIHTFLKPGFYLFSGLILASILVNLTWNLSRSKAKS